MRRILTEGRRCIRQPGMGTRRWCGLLLEHEADVDAKDTDGGAALRRAAEYGYEVGTCSTDSLSCSSCCSVVLPFFVLVYSASAQRVLVAVGAGEWQSLENGSRRRMVVAATVSVAV
jgi:hypothetical protein